MSAASGFETCTTDKREGQHVDAIPTGHAQMRLTAVMSAVCAVGVACAGTPAGSTSSTRAYVFGVVTADGSPIANVVVRGRAHEGGCSTDATAAVADGQPAIVLTDQSGRYRQLLTSSHSPFLGCVVVSAYATNTSTEPVATASGATVPFSPANEAQEYDSVEVNLEYR
jgi:hypothetical protein